MNKILVQLPYHSKYHPNACKQGERGLLNLHRIQHKQVNNLKNYCHIRCHISEMQSVISAVDKYSALQLSNQDLRVHFKRKCRKSRKSNYYMETIEHIISRCIVLAAKYYAKRHDLTAGILYKSNKKMYCKD